MEHRAQRDADWMEGAGSPAGGGARSLGKGVIRLTDVSPRDGLQNEAELVPTEGKIELVSSLLDAGVDEIEVTSFVSRKWIPQLGDAGEVCAGVAGKLRSGQSKLPNGQMAKWPRSSQEGASPVLSALVPNAKGYEGLAAVNQGAGFKMIGKASVFTAASQSFCQKNINATIAESIERFGPVIEASHRDGLLVRGYVSCVIACPFEGVIAPGAVAEVTRMLVDAGVDEIDLGDTIGAGDEASVERMLGACLREFERAGWVRPGEGGSSVMDAERVTLHLHDTFGKAGACVRRALELGVRSFDGAVGGLGGCPYASVPGKRAPGNVDLGLVCEVAKAAGYLVRADRDVIKRASMLARKLTGRLAGELA